MFKKVYSKLANSLSHRIANILLDKNRELIDDTIESIRRNNDSIHGKLETINHVLEALTTQMSGESIRNNLHVALWEKSQDIQYELSQSARNSSAEYVMMNMREVMSLANKYDVLTNALDKVKDSSGLFLEFGVYQGDTINFVSSKINTTVHGFDSFDGLPEFWRDGFDRGCFDIDALPKVNPNVILHQGWFDKSIVEFLENDTSEFISFLHVDCDLYSSTQTIFDLIGDKIKKGTVIVFDEYFNYDGWEAGEYKAFQEFIKESGLTYKYLSYNRYHEQVSVLIT